MLDVGGVGYLVAATPSVAAARRTARTRSTVETYLHVREDALQLYGFADRAERELFVQLLTVNGIGPKVALAIVSGSPPDELRRAIVREDTARFEAIPGIGKKTAERIVLELKEKLGRGAPSRAPSARRRHRRRARCARRARLLARRGRAGACATSIPIAAAGGARPPRAEEGGMSAQFLAPVVARGRGGARADAAAAPRSTTSSARSA